MILFIFEGNRREPRLFDAIRELFMPKETESIVCTYGCNIYRLYSQIKSLDAFDDSSSVDTVAILKEMLMQRNDHTLDGIRRDRISEIYLFFDYDFHHHSLEELASDNSHLQELLHFFHDETINGKLYINYPMIESIRYTKELPDSNYISYTITREECKTENFKSIAHKFSHYNSLDHLILSNNPKESEQKRQLRHTKAKHNWLYLIHMNVTKANYICNESVEMPATKHLISQSAIFDAQLHKHINDDECRVAILNSFPIFIFEYLKALPNN